MKIELCINVRMVSVLEVGKRMKGILSISMKEFEAILL